MATALPSVRSARAPVDHGTRRWVSTQPQRSARAQFQRAEQKLQGRVGLNVPQPHAETFLRAVRTIAQRHAVQHHPQFSSRGADRRLVVPPTSSAARPGRASPILRPFWPRTLDMTRPQSARHPVPPAPSSSLTPSPRALDQSGASRFHELCCRSAVQHHMDTHEADMYEIRKVKRPRSSHMTLTPLPPELVRSDLHLILPRLR